MKIKVKNFLLMLPIRLFMIFYIIIISSSLRNIIDLPITLVYFSILTLLYFKYLDPQFKKHIIKGKDLI